MSFPGVVPLRPGALRLAEAMDVLDGRVPLPAGRSVRSAAVLARQALEQNVEARVARLAPGIGSRASMKSRLVILQRLGDERLGRLARTAWDGLSLACHQHAYEIQPSALEVRELLRIVGQVILPQRASAS